MYRWFCAGAQALGRWSSGRWFSSMPRTLEVDGLALTVSDNGADYYRA